ncbi:MAG TPA: type II toxin-antitoxin system prevent-host-death family antitoxin [Verrucomicrobiae bacterium]|nr:type II toxin-antitoxin system prevent-host-death family antitoxin [Verrucomicrobiae bacterium]
MKDSTISVTEAARNFADCINRVHYQNRSFVLVKNGKPLARLVPKTEKVCTGKELAAALRRFRLSPADSRAWRKDLAQARKILKPVADKWQ